MTLGVLFVIGAFALGSIPFGVLISRLFFGTDLRAHGSGNIGAANALRTIGKGGAAGVLVLDALKGFAPTFVALRLLDERWAVGVALAAVIGHCFSPLLRFKGGKGVATSLGAIFALAWPAGLVFMATWIIGAFATNYSSVGSLAASIIAIVPLYLLLGQSGALYGLLAANLIASKHRENIARLRAGNENPMRKP